MISRDALLQEVQEARKAADLLEMVIKTPSNPSQVATIREFAADLIHAGEEIRRMAPPQARLP
jgi:hypothetical protein